MKLIFKGQFIEATAESLEENVMLMKLQSNKKEDRRGSEEVIQKGWETRRAKYGHKGHSKPNQKQIEGGKKAWQTRLKREGKDKLEADLGRALEARWGRKVPVRIVT